MTTLTLTAKGQITLKKELLQHLGVGVGDKINVEKLPDGSLSIQAVKRPEKMRSFADFAGCLPNKTGKTFSIEEINEAIAEAYVEAAMRGLKP